MLGLFDNDDNSLFPHIYVFSSWDSFIRTYTQILAEIHSNSLQGLYRLILSVTVQEVWNRSTCWASSMNFISKQIRNRFHYLRPRVPHFGTNSINVLALAPDPDPHCPHRGVDEAAMTSLYPHLGTTNREMKEGNAPERDNGYERRWYIVDFLMIVKKWWRYCSWVTWVIHFLWLTVYLTYSWNILELQQFGLLDEQKIFTWWYIHSLRNGGLEIHLCGIGINWIQVVKREKESLCISRVS